MRSCRCLCLESAMCVAKMVKFQYTCGTKLFSSNEDKKGNEMESENVLVRAHSTIIVQFPNEYFDCVHNLRWRMYIYIIYTHICMYSMSALYAVLLGLQPWATKNAERSQSV